MRKNFPNLTQKQKSMLRKYKSSSRRKIRKLFGWVLLIICLFIVAVGIGYFSVNVSQNKSKDITNTGNNISFGYSLSTADKSPDKIPEYFGEDVIVLNDNMPNFNRYDIENITGENYSDLDHLGRCGGAVAMLDRTMMPTDKRGDIGQNANEKNLITGTRYMNAVTMLPYEEKVMRYLDNSDNHVLYRVTPYFKDKELLSRGVEMEAYSIEDKGEGLHFHVFIYNIQSGIEIDYRTGESKKL